MKQLISLVFLAAATVACSSAEAPADPQQGLATANTPASDSPAASAAGEEQAPESMEQKIRRYLPGTWRVEKVVPPMRVTGTSRFAADGTVAYQGVSEMNGMRREMSYQAQWSVSGSTLTTTITESSMPQAVRVGHVNTYRIQSIDDQQFVYIADDGEVWTEQRVN